MDRARRLLEQLEAIRSELQKTVSKTRSTPFAWLATDDFNGLSVTRKEAYLKELADHLHKERAARAHGVVRSRSNVFLIAGEKRQ